MALTSGKPRQSAPPPARPRLLGRYHVLDEIGHNAVGPLYLARLEGPKGFQRWAAIRRVNRAHLVEPGYVQHFYDRVREGAKLLHPNITALFEVDEEDGVPWVAMEYLHGARLEEAIERLEIADTPISWEIASRIIADAAEGLHAVHNLRDKDNKPLGLLHGDLAPHSVVVTYEGKTKIKGAFEPRVHGVLDPRKTAYAAPEQLFDGVVDARADVFALGVLLWELLTGKRLFKRKTDDETRAMIEAGVVPPLDELVAEVPEELNALVRRTLVRNPTQRFPSARELSRELEGLLVAKGVVARDDDVGRYMRTLFADRYVEQEARLQAAADTTEVFRKSRSKLPLQSGAVPTALPDLSTTAEDEDENEETELMRSPIARDDDDRTTGERMAPVAAPTVRDVAPAGAISGYTDEILADSGPTLPKRPPPKKPNDSDDTQTVTQTLPQPPKPSPVDEPTLTAPLLTPEKGVASTGRLIMPKQITSDADITESAIFVAPRMPANTPSPEPRPLPPRPTTPSFPDRPLLPNTPPTGVMEMDPNATQPPTRQGVFQLRPPQQASAAFPVPNAFEGRNERTVQQRGPHAALTTGPLRAILFPQDRAKRVAVVSIVGFAGGALLFVLFFAVWHLAQGSTTTASSASARPDRSPAQQANPPPIRLTANTPNTAATTPPATATATVTTPPPAPTPTPTPIATIDLAQRPVTTHRVAPRPPPPPPTTAVAATASGKTGFLTVICKPACDHVLDQGRDLGGTPLYRQEVPVGKHRLVLRVETPHAEKVVFVDVVEGDTATVKSDVQ